MFFIRKRKNQENRLPFNETYFKNQIESRNSRQETQILLYNVLFVAI